ncbi:AEC family transporter [Phytohalomonas tamaricis]|uniref:AEC family transporter n=1 Tax=Phytohalomonas tamaricis TaxID=2081032 RepID=UPI000D0B1DA6|nr:AEC family transporter [Phytohalomonas tamaricis]
MLGILSITAPIFILIALGYLAVLARIVTKVQIQGLGAFVINFALPALIIKSLTEHPLTEVLNAHYLLAYGLGSMTIYCLAVCYAKFVQRKPLDKSALYALGMSTSNSGFIGYPIAVMVVGSPAGVALALCMLVENMMMIPTGLALAEAGAQSGASIKNVLRMSAARLIRNPIILSIVAGAVLSLSSAELPAPLFKAIDMLATASAPTALFVIGGSLFGIKVQGMVSDVSQIVLGKLVLHPVAVCLAFLIFPAVDPALKVAAIVIASSPMLSVYPIFGQRFNLEGLCAAALMMSAVASFITISTLIWIIDRSTLFAIGG